MNTKEKRELYSLFEQKAASLVVLLNSHDTGINVSDESLKSAGYADFIEEAQVEYLRTWKNKLEKLISMEEKQFGNLIKSWSIITGVKQ